MTNGLVLFETQYVNRPIINNADKHCEFALITFKLASFSLLLFSD